MTPQRVQRTYLILILLQTLAASLIWGVNTLFLLDAGLSITEAFIANAAFTAGMVLFEIPTGVVADASGRRMSFILGAVTLLVTTMAYLGLWYFGAALWAWMVVSALIGLGFTFFSGATEAWLIDALDATGFDGAVETVFGRGQTVGGAATLVGTIGGGFLAQISLGVPYLVRSALLVVVIGAAYLWMHDIGYTPVHRDSIREEVTVILRDSIKHGFGNPAVRMFMFGAPFYMGVFFWVFYAFQPYLLDLFGDKEAFYLAGIAAAVFAVAQMIGGSMVNVIRRLFKRRTTLIAASVVISSVALVGVGLAEFLEIPVGFWAAIALLTVVTLATTIAQPVRQAYLNQVIPSEQRATVLSFDSLMGSAGGVVGQPVLGKVADVYSLGIGYIVAGVVYTFRIPFVLAVRRLNLAADEVAQTEAIPPA